MKKLVILIISVFSMYSLCLSNDNYQELFNKANQLYNSKNFVEAINLYHKILKEGYVSANVYYNLANSYYRNNQIGEAILYYNKAHKINPEDESINLNLKIANLKTVDKIKELPKFFLTKWINDITHNISVGSASFWTILFWIGGFIFLAIFLLSQSILIKKIVFFSAVVSFIFAILFFYITIEAQNFQNSQNEGIILVPSVYVKSSPDASSLDAFILHEGTSFNVLDQVGNWTKIKIPSGNIGWIQSNSFETF